MVTKSSSICFAAYYAIDHTAARACSAHHKNTNDVCERPRRCGAAVVAGGWLMGVVNRDNNGLAVQ